MTVGQEIRMNILMVGAFADILTTYVGIQKFGMHEGNPIIRWGFENLGFTNIAILKLALSIFLAKRASSLACSINWIGPMNNTIAMLTRTK